MIHSGEKNKHISNKVSYCYSQDLMDAVFSSLNGKQANEIKLILLLLGNIGNGDFGLSTKFILTHSGMSKTAYYNARKHLKEMGWISINNSFIVVNTDKIYSDSQK